jgi:hypothetical protein
MRPELRVSVPFTPRRAPGRETGVTACGKEPYDLGVWLSDHDNEKIKEMAFTRQRTIVMSRRLLG